VKSQNPTELSHAEGLLRILELAWMQERKAQIRSQGR
jgi:hypothetical protein